VNSWIGRGGWCRAAKGFVRPHPCAGIERDNRLAVTRLLRELAKVGFDQYVRFIAPLIGILLVLILAVLLLGAARLTASSG
jgi:hypothetical protein